MSELLRFRVQMAMVVIALALPTRCRSSASAPAPRLDGAVCHAFQDGVLTAGRCDASDPLWYADERLRRAAGAPVCWWHASPERLQDIRGVGPAVAGKLAEHRASGGAWEDVESVRGIGPVLANAFADGSTTNCAHVPIPSQVTDGVDSAPERVIPWDE